MDTLLGKLKNPLLAALVAVIFGFAFGLIWGWVIDPVDFIDAAPEVLNADYQREYLRMTIDSFSINSDTALAMQRWKNLGPSAQARLAEIEAAPGAQDKATVDAFGQLMNVTSTETEAPATPEAETSSTLRYLFIFIGLIAVGAVGFFAYRILRPSISKGSEETPAQKAAALNQNTEQTDYSEKGWAPPITQTMTSYVAGDKLYNESFSIQSQAGNFLGEYGIEISHRIDVGTSQEVAALEVWLFDTQDKETATKVLLSEHAYNDPDIHQRLQPKGELVVVSPDKQIMLETRTLQLLVKVADLEYGTEAPPPRGYFAKAALELAVWPKDNV